MELKYIKNQKKKVILDIQEMRLLIEHTVEFMRMIINYLKPNVKVLSDDAEVEKNYIKYI